MAPFAIKENILSLANKALSVLFVIALITFLYGYLSYERYDWVASESPINVAANGEYRISFRSQMDAQYELKLETERALELNEQNCRLGIKISDSFLCGDKKERLILKWSISDGSNEIAVGLSNESALGFWGPTIGKTLHNFRTEKGKDYTIKVQVVNTDPSLAVTNPILKVSIGSLEHKDAVVVSTLAIYISYILASIGALALLIGFVQRLWIQKHNKKRRVDA